MSARMLNAAVFASGGGSNFQALLDREGKGGALWRTRLLVVDRLGIGAIERAERAELWERPVADDKVPLLRRKKLRHGRRVLHALVHNRASDRSERA